MKRIIALALLAGAASPLLAQSKPQAPGLHARTSAATYVRMAASSDTYEKQSSQMMLGEATNPDVRRFAEMMVADHTKTSADVMAAAKSASIGKPGGILSKQVTMLKKLRQTARAKRERTYIDQQVMAHEEALLLHQGYAEQGDNPGLRAAASGAVPVVQAHLTEIRRIQAAMGGPMTASR